MHKIYGLVGFPIGHSFSKQYFTEKFAKEGIDASFENFSMQNIEDIIEIIQTTPGLSGLNITIPHKQNIIPLLDNLAKDIEAIGAVNVVKIFKNNDHIRLKGFNTDVVGFRKSFELKLKKHHTHALVLGTGGASKAIIYALEQLGIEYLLVSRNGRDNKTISYADINQSLLDKYSVIINCTPVGMHPHISAFPDIPYQFITEKHYLYDLVYNPIETRFLKMGKDQGADIMNGLEMLILQAEAAWKIWNE